MLALNPMIFWKVLSITDSDGLDYISYKYMAYFDNNPNEPIRPLY